ncbi:MAG: hypothetical protein WCK35_03390 [Chloroflexota bacterium]
MPAIDIARLKIHAAVLVEKFDQPVAFLKDLHTILDIYADRTIRQGINASPVTVLPAFRVPQAVLRQIEMEIGPLAATFPDQTIALTNSLWKDGYLESRLLAAALLGRIHPETIFLLEHITAWVSHTRDNSLRRALLRTSLSRIRKETPSKFLLLMRDWLDPSTPKMWANAIHAIIPLLEDPTYQNLPPVYTLLSPAIKSMPSIMQNDLADLINALYIASPIETTFFLRQVIIGASSHQMPITIRRILPQLPADLRPVILEIVRLKSAQA